MDPKKQVIQSNQEVHVWFIYGMAEYGGECGKWGQW